MYVTLYNNILQRLLRTLGLVDLAMPSLCPAETIVHQPGILKMLTLNKIALEETRLCDSARLACKQKNRQQ